MQHKELDELELDSKELVYLLQKARQDELLVPIVKRHIDRLIKKLEDIKDELDCPGMVSPTVEEETVYVEEEDLAAEESAVIEEVAVEETFIAPEVIEAEDIPEKVMGVQDKSMTSVTVLGERLKPAAELSKGLSLNDTFRFSRELFNDDKDEMNRVLQEISNMNSLSEAISYLSMYVEWDEENEVTKDFVELLKKYFV